MEYHAKVLSARTVDSEPSLILRFPTAQYLFNVGEGTQRIFQETLTSTKYMEGIFLTGLSTEEAGGLSGMMFTLADKNSRAMNIVGPENLSHLVASMRGYYNRSDLYLNLIERPISTPFTDDSPVFQDPQITVYSVVLNPSSASPTSALSNDDSEPLRKRKRSLSPLTDASAEPTEPTLPAEPSFSNEESQARAIYQFRRESMLRMSAGTSPYSSPSLRDPRPSDFRLPNPILLLPPLDSSRPAPPAPNTQHAALPRPIRPIPLDAKLCYIVVGPTKRGKFLVEIADSFGVEKRDRGKLAGKGESVWVNDATAEGGKREVTPAMCLGKEIPASVTLIIDCPSSAHALQLVDNPIWKQYQVSNEDGIYPVHIIWHRWGTWENDPRYQDWMKSFGPDVQHLSGDQTINGNTTTFNSSAVTAVNLSLLDPKIFPRQDLTPGPSGRLLPPNHYPFKPTQIIKILPREPPTPLGALTTNIHARIPISSSFLADSETLSTSQLVRRLEELVPGFTEEIEKAREAVIAGEQSGERERRVVDDVVVTTLGTGSSLPSKYRNVSSTHLLVPGYGGIMLDCGEGTLGQLSRSFGSAGVLDTLRNLKLIFISHMHADHHTGLIRLLSLRRKVTDPSNTLFIVGPDRIRTMIQETQEFQDLGFDFNSSTSQIQFGACPSLLPTWNLRIEAKAVLAQLYVATGLSKISTCLVPHRGSQCYAVILEHQDGWKIVYSGDTKPSEALIAAGQNATLLIHEATIGDDTDEEIALMHEMRKFAKENDLEPPTASLLSELACAKGHSTFAQAIEVGRRMHASSTLLTHFSQRYPKSVSITIAPPNPLTSSPRTLQTAQTQDVALALDLMRIPLGDMWKMRIYQKAVEALYATLPEEEEGEAEGEGGEGEKKAKGFGGGGAGKGGRSAKQAESGVGGGAKKEKGKKQGGGKKTDASTTAVAAPSA